MTDGAPAIVASASSRRGWATVIYWYIVVIYRVNAREPCAPHSPFHSATLRLNCCHSWVPSPPPPTVHAAAVACTEQHATRARNRPVRVPACRESVWRRSVRAAKCEMSGFAPSKCEVSNFAYAKCEMSDFEPSKYAKCEVSGFALAKCTVQIAPAPEHFARTTHARERARARTSTCIPTPLCDTFY